MPDSGMNTSATETIWAKRAIAESYAEDKAFKGLIGVMKEDIPATGKPIVMRNDFKGQAGDTAHIELIIDLNGEGIVGDATAEGNEEQIYNYDFSFDVNLLRNAVKEKGRMDAQKSSVKMYSKFSKLLKDWYRKKRTREICRKAMGLTAYTFSNTPTAATTDRAIYCGSSTATNDITSSDKLSPTDISKAVVYARNTRLTGTDGQPVPPISPINFGDIEAYLLLVHPEVMYDIFNDAQMQQLLREAEIRGKENPLFRMGDLYYNGCVIRQLDEMRDGEVAVWGSGSDQPGAYSILMGSNAIVMAEADSPRLVYEDFDYKNKRGAAIGNIWGVQKPKYNGEDLALITLHSYRSSL